MAVRVDLRVAEDRRHAIFKPLGNKMLQAFCLLMHLVPGVFQDIVKEQFEQPVMAHQLPGAAFSCRREPDAPVLLIRDECRTLRGKPLNHPRHRRRSYAQPFGEGICCNRQLIGACVCGDTPANCQFENLGRNALRDPDFVWSDLYLTKWFALTEKVKFRLDAQFFNLFNHPNFALPSVVYAGIPDKPSTQTGFGALTYTTSPPTGLLGVGLGGDSSPRMIAFQARLEF